MSALLGLVLMQTLGALVRRVTTGLALGRALRSPASFFIAAALGHALCLGLAGTGVLLLVLAALVANREGAASLGRRGQWGLLALGGLVLARPMVPTMWDELVWLGKARLGAEGLFGVVEAALDAHARVVPAGYPPLWPTLVGWVSLGRDGLHTQVLAASLVMLMCAAVAVESWAQTLEAGRGWWRVAPLLAPLLWVHLRSTYVDVPMGLLGVALVPRLLERRALGVSCALAVVLVGFKDEGLAHVVAAGAVVMVLSRRLAPLAPVFLAGATVAVWRWSLLAAHVEAFDHAVHAPALDWVPTAANLVVLHASDLFTWGFFWPVTVAALLRGSRTAELRAVKWTLVLVVFLLLWALLLGPERVRVFAENGTLLNRMLLQVWPMAAVLVLLTFDETSPPRAADDSSVTRQGA